MDKQQLHTMLEQLHAELEQTQSVDEPDRALLQDLMGHIQMVIKQGDAVPPQHYVSLGARLNNALDQFEISHPDLTLTIGRVLDNFAKV